MKTGAIGTGYTLFFFSSHVCVVTLYVYHRKFRDTITDTTTAPSFYFFLLATTIIIIGCATLQCGFIIRLNAIVVTVFFKSQPPFARKRKKRLEIARKSARGASRILSCTGAFLLIFVCFAQTWHR